MKKTSNNINSAKYITNLKFKKIKSADKSSNHEYEFEKIRGPLPFKTMTTGKGFGPFIELTDGSVKYDMTSSLGLEVLGKNHPIYYNFHNELVTASRINNLIPHVEISKLSHELKSFININNFDHIWFTSSGTLANENALKLIIHNSQSLDIDLFITEGSFFGKSFGLNLLNEIDIIKFSDNKNINIFQIPFHLNHDECIEFISSKTNPKNYKSFATELIFGKKGGVHHDYKYYQNIFKYLKENKFLTWVDEVQSFGRTTEITATKLFKLENMVDILTFGKVLPTPGVIFSNKLQFTPEILGGTSPCSIENCQLSFKIIELMRNGNIYGAKGNIHRLQEFIKTQFSSIVKSKNIKDFKITGLFASYLYQNGDHELSLKFIKELYKNGIICLPSSFQSKTRIKMLLPLRITDEDIVNILNIIEHTSSVTKE